MENPVDLTNLRDMIDGDTAMEQELFREFFTSFEAEMKILQDSFAKGTAATWQASAHALKGMSLSLGAGILGEYCARAQDLAQATPDDKRVMLANIRAEYERVRQFLLQTMAA